MALEGTHSKIQHGQKVTPSYHFSGERSSDIMLLGHGCLGSYAQFYELSPHVMQRDAQMESSYGISSARTSPAIGKH